MKKQIIVDKVEGGWKIWWISEKTGSRECVSFSIEDALERLTKIVFDLDDDSKVSKLDYKPTS